jgi:hypothetical protein
MGFDVWLFLALDPASGPVLAISGRHRKTEGRQLVYGVGLSSDEERSAFAIYEEQRLGTAFANRVLELRDVADRLMIDFLDDIALLQARVGHFAGRVDAGDDDAFGCRGDVQFLRDVCA